MKLLSGILGLTLTSVVALASANAADIYRAEGPGSLKDPVYPVTSWTGFYVGVNGGYAFSGDSTTIDEFVASGALRDRYRGAKLEGGFGGGQVGYNWQFGGGGYKDSGPSRWVVGIEADIQGADISDSYTQPALLSGVVGRLNSSVDWFGTVRGRLGYSFDRALVYATGGLAYGNVRTNYFDGIDRLHRDDTQTGYAVGGGIEYKIDPHWSLKAEYQYINLGDQSVNGVIIATSAPLHTNDLTTDFHTVRAGLNYKIGHEYEPLK